MATGCLRYKRILRSTVRKISDSYFHGFCKKGKQKGNRAGFWWAAPALFKSGWNWTRPWLELWKKLGSKKLNSGICFDQRGVP